MSNQWITLQLLIIGTNWFSYLLVICRRTIPSTCLQSFSKTALKKMKLELEKAIFYGDGSRRSNHVVVVFFLFDKDYFVQTQNGFLFVIQIIFLHFARYTHSDIYFMLSLVVVKWNEFSQLFYRKYTHIFTVNHPLLGVVSRKWCYIFKCIVDL